MLQSRPIQIEQTINLGYDDQDNRMIATFPNEEYNILIQELMLEKYWNEVRVLKL
jgi:hypothetical protein